MGNDEMSIFIENKIQAIFIRVWWVETNVDKINDEKIINEVAEKAINVTLKTEIHIR